MQLEVVTTLGGLRRLETDWETLALPSPMQSPGWLISWWEAYGADDASRQLAVLAIRDAEDQLIGIAPWYTHQRALAGATLRFLGDGRASTDHQTVLCRSAENEPAVVAEISRWMIQTAGEAWRRVRFEALDTDNRAMNELERLLIEAGLETERIDDLGSFPAKLAADDRQPTWDNYLGTLSKNRRKRLRKWDRDIFATGKAVVRVAKTETERKALWPLLVRLHRERREAMGCEGVFDESRFDRFHRLASERLFAQGKIYLAVLELHGKPAAIEYALQDDHAIYAYQGGIAPWALEHDAGHLSLMALAQSAIVSGRTRLDLLRGDEPYKLSWGAVHRPATTLHARPRDMAGALESWAGTTYRSFRDRRQAVAE